MHVGRDAVATDVAPAVALVPVLFAPAVPAPDNSRLPAPTTDDAMTLLRMTDLDLSGKRVLIREDLNVPIEDGRITSEQRITAALPTLKLAL